MIVTPIFCKDIDIWLNTDKNARLSFSEVFILLLRNAVILIVHSHVESSLRCLYVRIEPQPSNAKRNGCQDSPFQKRKMKAKQFHLATAHHSTT